MGDDIKNCWQTFFSLLFLTVHCVLSSLLFWTLRIINDFVRYLSDFVVSVAGPMAGYVSFASGNFDTLVNNHFICFMNRICFTFTDIALTFNSHICISFLHLYPFLRSCLSNSDLFCQSIQPTPPPPFRWMARELHGLFTTSTPPRTRSWSYNSFHKPSCQNFAPLDYLVAPQDKGYLVTFAKY